MTAMAVNVMGRAFRAKFLLHVHHDIITLVLGSRYFDQLNAMHGWPAAVMGTGINVLRAVDWDLENSANENLRGLGER